MTQRLPPLNALRAFEAAARHLSFSKAADELSVTPAAISHQIKSLEEYLDVRLFRRLNKGLLLTGAGQCPQSIVDVAAFRQWVIGEAESMSGEAQTHAT